MNNTTKQHHYIFYGTQCNALEVRKFLEYNLQVGQNNPKQIPPTPLCIWGRHGLGKTELVQNLAQELGYEWAYIAPAQFEEMGDLIGLPQAQQGQTHFLPPAWVPQTPGPGILLIDDVNRADDRILRGIMQLLQNYELTSWKLPKAWQIILTANPDGGDYSVTPMDDAILTRMMHISLIFDAKIWAKWAENNHIDPRGINFVLTYPETVSGERTTPRSLVQFFRAIEKIQDLEENIALVQMLGDACLDASTVTAFVQFVRNKLSRLPSPETMLESKDFAKEIAQPLKKLVVQGTLRVDILATLATRLINYLSAKGYKPSTQALLNLKAFLKLDYLPNDIRLAMAQDLVSATEPSLKTIMADPEIARILLQRM